MRSNTPFARDRAPAMGRAGTRTRANRWLILGACAACSCAHPRAEPPKGVEPVRTATTAAERPAEDATPEQPGPVRGRVVRDKRLRGAAPDVITAWIVYGSVRAILWQLWDSPARDRSGDDYWIEAEARRVLAESWAEDRAAGAAPDPYLDALVEIAKQGLLEEYVISSFAVPGWTIPSDVLAKLELARYERWAKEHLADHHPVTLASFIPEHGVLYGPAPGEDLPSPASFAAEQCAASRPKLAAAIESWKKGEGSLGGLSSVFAEDRASFVAALAAAPRGSGETSRGVVWVASRVVELVDLAAACAKETGDKREAKRLQIEARALRGSR